MITRKVDKEVTMVIFEAEDSAPFLSRALLKIGERVVVQCSLTGIDKWKWFIPISYEEHLNEKIKELIDGKS